MKNHWILSKLDYKQDISSSVFHWKFSKKRLIGLGFFLLIFGFVSYFWMFDPNQSTEQSETYLLTLDNKYKSGQKLSNQEWMDYCILLQKIWRQHRTDCFCSEVKNPTHGIDWTNPPDSPEKLSSDWELIQYPNVGQNKKRMDFHNVHTGEKIAFDSESTKDPNQIKQPHWHRYNPNSTSTSDYYLDMCGKPIHKSHKNSHIYIRN